VTIAIGVDPGDSCGLSIINTTHRSALWDVIQDRPERVMAQLRTALSLLQETETVVGVFCERYTSSGQGKRTHQPTAQRVTGVVESIAFSYGVSFYLQNPGDAKHFAPNALLRDLNLLVTARDVQQRDANDVNDATRHALLGLATVDRLAYDALLRAHNL
jgi:hypothetical protein